MMYFSIPLVDLFSLACAAAAYYQHMLTLEGEESGLLGRNVNKKMHIIIIGPMLLRVQNISTKMKLTWGLVYTPNTSIL